MQNSKLLRQKLKEKKLCLGTHIGKTEPALTEILARSNILDFVWVEMEHASISIETVDHHIMATRNSNLPTIVRVPWNDHVLIKPVLDSGADGIITPLIRSAKEAEMAVSACLYPPQGIRGYGPNRAALYTQSVGPDYIKEANESVVIIVQIEHIDAVNDLDAILDVPGITTIVIGPNDLSASLGYPAQPRHPEVLKTVDRIFEAANKVCMPVGVSIPYDLEIARDWVNRGCRWISTGAVIPFFLNGLKQMSDDVRK